MSTQQVDAGGVVPQWDTADRMRKALRTSGVPVAEMADYLGVARNTVSTWINGKIAPSRQTLRLWALRTGVPFEWLETGRVAGGVRREGIEPPTRCYAAPRRRRRVRRSTWWADVIQLPVRPAAPGRAVA